MSDSGSDDVSDIQDQESEEEIVELDDEVDNEDNKKPNKKPKPESNKKSNNLQKTSKTSKTNRTNTFKSNADFASTIEPNGKTVFSRWSESLFDEYLANEKNSKPKAFEKLMNENIIKANTSKVNSKENKEKFKNMMARHEQYEEEKNNKMKQRQDQLNQQHKKNCTWTPNGTKLTNVKTNEEFYEEQKQFLATVKKDKEKINEDFLKQEQKDQVGVLVSKNSLKIVEKKRGNETDEEFVTRWQGEKLRNIKEKEIKWKEGDKESAKNKVKKDKKEEKKWTESEKNNLFNKLHQDKQTRWQNEKELVEKVRPSKAKEVDLISLPTKKVLLDKFIVAYEKAVLELFNKKGNFKISSSEYGLLLKTIGCVKETDNLNSWKHLNPMEDQIDTYQFVLFMWAVFNIYKGSDLCFFISNDKVIEESDGLTVEDKKLISAEYHWIRKSIPELDLEKYKYDSEKCKVIKKKYLSFSSNITEQFKAEQTKRREENKKKNQNEDIPTKRVKNYSKVIEESRKKMYNEAMEEIETLKQREGTKSWSPDQKMLKKKLENNSLKLEDVYKILQKRKEYEIEEARTKKEQDIFAACTFQPNADTKPVNPKDVAANIEKWYKDGKITYKKKLKQEDNTDEKKEVLVQCTFKPEIHPMNNEIFGINPLSNDEKLKNEITRLEQARQEKAIINQHSELGFTNTRLFNADETKFVQPKTMTFSIEKKFGKDGFEIFDEKRKKVIISNGTKNTSSFRYEENSARKDGVEPWLKVEVNIDDNNRIVKLEIYPGDDPVKIAEKFCKKHGLSHDKKERWQQIIQEKINEATNDNLSGSQQ